MNDIIPKPSSLPGALAWEIARVAAKRQRWITMEVLGDAAQPAILLMTQTLARAIAAADSGDIEAQIRAIEDLKGWSDDD